MVWQHVRIASLVSVQLLLHSAVQIYNIWRKKTRGVLFHLDSKFSATFKLGIKIVWVYQCYFVSSCTLWIFFNWLWMDVTHSYRTRNSRLARGRPNSMAKSKMKRGVLLQTSLQNSHIVCCAHPCQNRVRTRENNIHSWVRARVIRNMVSIHYAFLGIILLHEFTHIIEFCINACDELWILRWIFGAVSKPIFMPQETIAGFNLGRAIEQWLEFRYNFRAHILQTAWLRSIAYDNIHISEQSTWVLEISIESSYFTTIAIHFYLNFSNITENNWLTKNFIDLPFPI